MKNPRAMQENLVKFLGREDLLETGKATYSSILAWRIAWTMQTMGLQRNTGFLVLEKAEKPEIKLPTSVGLSSNRVSQKHLLLLY